ncbi:very long-chain acyl-CoA synthetase-like isoform X1 [Haliotis rufescens]|uniref:very long-chain acyl-CoA synthetase-like isoform X1 n=1 Tax=Haliotis rufescens TaxID=6454 RepID=UPI00201F5A23|nr:very long-chain acyl-CoA synthetase-like isoform X1 [Haliotis rufescens]XP_048253920.1 very long-chain acyl-CoA synthetase-like isoform X1 [Haliotis rufescens]
MLDKVAYGVAGAAGVSVVAWKTMFPWINHDLKVMKVGKNVKSQMEKDAESGEFLIDRFEKHVYNQPRKPFIIFEGSVFTYEYVNQQANRVANVVKTWGLSVGDTVAIMIYNEPAFVWTFLGLQKLGIAAALINFNLRQKQLSHSVNVSGAKAFIVGQGAELFEAVHVEEGEFSGMPIYIQGCTANQLPAGYNSFDDLMVVSSPVGVDPSVRATVTLMTTACYIYTSGTTGYPKPSIIPQKKMMGYTLGLQVVSLSVTDTVYNCLPMYHVSGIGVGVGGVVSVGLPKPVFIRQMKLTSLSGGFLLVDFNKDDVLYMTLPLYHSAGGGLGHYGCIRAGATMVLRGKFSASHFWEDCCRYRVTVIQYIGELFRYLLSRPESPEEKSHQVRAAFGNGLRRDIWEQVQARFRIPQITEFFGATEGNTMLFNVSNKPGAIGRLSPLLRKLTPNYQTLVKYDFATAEPVRDSNGHCIEIKPGEKGLFISAIAPEMEGVEFYKASKAANEKKLVRNAFKKGDSYFNFGDLFYLDREYFVYFVDRIGDTFRWKGENVSTTEVANILSSLDFVHDANVYGVTVPGHDGRAGMAALTLYDDRPLTPELLRTIWKHSEEHLATYARPMFLRLQKEATLTATFKQRKVELVEEGFDINKILDPLYYADQVTKSYIPIKQDTYSRILTTSKL